MPFVFLIKLNLISCRICLQWGKLPVWSSRHLRISSDSSQMSACKREMLRKAGHRKKYTLSKNHKIWENWLCDWVAIIRLVVGEVEEIVNFERVFFLNIDFGYVVFLGYVWVKFIHLCILIHLFSKTLQFWEYAQFFSSYKRADAWCMYISHQKNTTFSLECESETRTWQGLILLILCPHNLFCHHFFIGTKSAIIS